MMPTLIELAGLPPCQELLGGKSLAAVIRNPPANGTAADFPYAFSQFPRCNCTYQTNVCVASVLLCVCVVLQLKDSWTR